jgi:hypothetical protein
MLGAIFSAIVLWRVLKIEKMLKKLAVPPPTVPEKPKEEIKLLPHKPKAPTEAQRVKMSQKRKEWWAKKKASENPFLEALKERD